MKSNNENQSQDAPVMETETVAMNLGEQESQAETAEQMEARIRQEMSEKHNADLKAQDERLARLEKGISPTEEPVKSYSVTEVNDLLDSMIAEKDALVEKLKGEKEDMVIDDTISRAMNSTLISKNLKGKFNPKKGVTNFMMRQNTKYAIEGKPEPYTIEALQNTLKREMGVS